jgi:hypothetical protein
MEFKTWDLLSTTMFYPAISTMLLPLIIHLTCWARVFTLRLQFNFRKHLIFPLMKPLSRRSVRILIQLGCHDCFNNAETIALITLTK